MTKTKLDITMFSSASSVPGQGVGSAYAEQVRLLQEGACDLYTVRENDWKSHADIQHFHTIDPAFFLRIRKPDALNIAYCHFVPDTLLDGSLRIPKVFHPIVSRYIISFYNAADRLVVVNPSFIDELVRYKIPREKITYIPNFVSHEDFHPTGDEDRHAWREKYGFSDDDFVVLGCGQVQTRKGVKDFVEVAKKLPQIKFLWAGGFSFGAITDGYDELKQIMDNPPENVVFPGIVDRKDMVHIYNLADTLFIPSYAELFPMTILEAANLSRPMVIRDLDLYKDILFDHYLKGENNEEFATLIEKLASDKDFYEKMAKESDELSHFYSKEHVLELWRKFYREAFVNKFKRESEPDS